MSNFNLRNSRPRRSVYLVIVAASFLTNVQAQIQATADSVQINNLKHLCKIWGFLKYNHPTVQRGELAWDEELLKLIPSTSNADFLENLVTELPSVEVGIEKVRQEGKENFRQLDLNAEIIDSTYNQELSTYLKNVLSTSNLSVQAYLEPGRWGITPKFKEPDKIEHDLEKVEHRLLTLFRYWNIVFYFNPYQDFVHGDWEELLVDQINRCFAASSTLEFKLNILELAVQTNDGHGGLWERGEGEMAKFFGQYQVPAEIDLQGGQPTVIALLKEDLPLKVGDVLISVGKELLAEKRERIERYIPASNAQGNSAGLSYNLLRTNDLETKVVIVRGGKQLSFIVETINATPIYYVQRKSKPSRMDISDAIGYIYPGSLAKNEIDTILVEFAEKKAIILDYRCYPTDLIQHKLIEFLFPYPRVAYRHTLYDVDNVGSHAIVPLEKAYKGGTYNSNYYKGKFIILMNHYSSSQPEFESYVLRHLPNVTLVGSETAGTIGNFTYIPLPGNLYSGISGTAVLRMDKSPIYKTGIIPDVYVSNTLEEVIEGTDAQLLKAIEIASDFP